MSKTKYEIYKCVSDDSLSRFNKITVDLNFLLGGHHNNHISFYLPETTTWADKIAFKCRPLAADYDEYHDYQQIVDLRQVFGYEDLYNGEEVGVIPQHWCERPLELKSTDTSEFADTFKLSPQKAPYDVSCRIKSYRKGEDCIIAPKDKLQYIENSEINKDNLSSEDSECVGDVFAGISASIVEPSLLDSNLFFRLYPEYISQGSNFYIKFEHDNYDGQISQLRTTTHDYSKDPDDVWDRGVFDKATSEDVICTYRDNFINTPIKINYTASPSFCFVVNWYELSSFLNSGGKIRFYEEIKGTDIVDKEKKPKYAMRIGADYIKAFNGSPANTTGYATKAGAPTPSTYQRLGVLDNVNEPIALNLSSPKVWRWIGLSWCSDHSSIKLIESLPKEIKVIGDYDPTEMFIVLCKSYREGSLSPYGREFEIVEKVPVSRYIDISNYTIAGEPKFNCIWIETTQEWVGKVIDGSISLELIYDVKPVNNVLKLVTSRERDCKFFRTQLDGDAVLAGLDYYLVRKLLKDNKLNLYIDKSNGNNIYNGYFTYNDCTIDYGKKTIRVKPNALDEYTDILNKYDQEYNLTELGVELETVTYSRVPIIQVYEEGQSIITTINNGLSFEESCESKTSTDDLLNHTIKGEGLEYFYKAGFTRAFGMEVELSWIEYDKNGNIVIWGRHTLAGSIDVRQDSSHENKFYINEANFKGGWSGRVDDYDNMFELRLLYKEEGYKQVQRYIVYHIPTRSQGDVINPQSVNPEKYADAFSDFMSRNVTGERTAVINLSDGGRIEITINLDISSKQRVLHRTWTRMLVAKQIEGSKKIDASTDICPKRHYSYAVPYASRVYYNYYITDDPVMSKYGKTDSDHYYSYKNIDISETRLSPIPVNKSIWTDASQWVLPQSAKEDYLYETYIENGTGTISFDSAMSIENVIQVLLKKYDLPLTFEGNKEHSLFLYSVGKTIDYRGEKVTPSLNYESEYVRYKLFITPISNILVGKYDTAARKANMSLKKILDLLEKCFRCYWYIEDGKLKIEHVRYFNNGLTYPYTNKDNSQLNLEEVIDPINKKRVTYFQNEITCDASSIPSKYTFEWGCGAELDGGEKVSLAINSELAEYNSTEDINATNFSADLDAQIGLSSHFNNDGFSLLIADTSGNANKVPIKFEQVYNVDTGTLSEAFKQNYILMWYNLAYNYYYKYEGVYEFKRAELNRNFTYDSTGVFVGTAPRIIRPEELLKVLEHKVSFIPYKEIDIYKNITTDVGIGTIDVLAEDLATGVTTLTLKYALK